MTGAREYLEFMARGDKPVNKVYQYTLQHGEFFQGALDHRALPRSALVRVLIKPRKKWCFYNAQLLGLLHPLHQIEYYEGVADNGIFTGAHAWNVYKGKAIDITWEDIPTEFADLPGVLSLEQFTYFGIKIPYEFVKNNNPVLKTSIEPLAFKWLGLDINNKSAQRKSLE